MRKLFSLAVLAATLCLPQLAFATIADDTGLTTTATNANSNWSNAGQNNLPQFIGSYIIQPILGVVGLIFFILIVYGGVLWMTAGGNTDQVKKAKSILINGVIGAAIVIASYAITSAIFYGLTTGNVTPTT